MQYDYVVYIGRFQLPTLAHKAMINKALEQGEKVIIVIGSNNATPSLRNPFTTSERQEMLLACIEEKDHERIIFIPIEDSAYNFPAWVREIRYKVSNITEDESKIGLLGHVKDCTSYYLKHFPEYEPIFIGSLYEGLSSTDIRNTLYQGRDEWVDYVPEKVSKWILDWLYTKKNKPRYENLVSEYKFIREYKAQWKSAPYAPTFITTDSVVICRGHILLIKRSGKLGNGKFALPGGFLEPNETILNGCIRELNEETSINIDSWLLQKSLIDMKHFDDPVRDPRGRTITFAHFFKLDLTYLPKIEAADDAMKVSWFRLADLEDLKGRFFNDHYQIIKYFLNKEILI